MSHQLSEIKPDTVIQNRKLAAYCLGRLLNELNWQLQLCFFWPEEEASSTGGVFDRLTAISYAFTDSTDADVQVRLEYLQRDWWETIDCENLAEDCRAELRDAIGPQGSGLDDARASLVSGWCDRFKENAHDILIPCLTEHERGLVTLGTLVDQGVRRSEIHRFMWTTERSDPNQLANYKPQQGEFEPDSPWRPQIAALAAKLKLGIKNLIEERENDSAVEFASSIDSLIQLCLLRSELPAEDETKADGPCDLRKWRHNGSVGKGQLRAGSWNLVKYLWENNFAASFDDLLEPVYGDREARASVNEFSSQRRDANSFFREHGIPLKVAVSKKTSTVVLSRINTP